MRYKMIVKRFASEDEIFECDTFSLDVKAEKKGLILGRVKYANDGSLGIYLDDKLVRIYPPNSYEFLLQDTEVIV